MSENAELEAMLETSVDATVETIAEIPAADPGGEAAQLESTGEESAEQSEEVTPTSEQYSPNEKALYAKSKAEKEKRQQADQRIRELELQIARHEGTKKPEAEEEVDFWTDPGKATETVLSKREQQQLTAKMNVSEVMARAELQDYDKYADHFIQNVAPGNPAMKDMLYAAPDPARFAYAMGKKAMDQIEATTKYSEVESSGGLDAYVQKQVQAALEAAKQGKKPVNVPPDLSKTQSKGGDPEANEIADGNDGLKQLLGR